MSCRQASRRFDPLPGVVALVARHGAARVGVAYALDADAVRRYLDGASQRATRWWFELHLEAVTRELNGGPVLRLVTGPSMPPGEVT